MTPSPAPESSSAAPVYVRRPTLLARTCAGVAIAFAAVIVLILLITIVVDPPTNARDLAVGLGMLVAVAAALTIGALVPLRRRLLADPAGVHVRGLLRTRHLPWPVTRTEIVTVPAFSVGSLARVVQLRPAGGGRIVTVHALTRPIWRASGSPSAEQEADDLWAWGVAHGLTGPGRPTPRSDGRALANAGATPPSAPSPLTGVDLTGERIVIPGGGPARRGALALAVIAVVFLIGPGLELVSRDASVPDRVGAVVALALGLVLATAALAAWRSRTVIDRDGFHVRSLGTRSAPWPASRSDLFVLIDSRRRGLVHARTILLADGGRGVALPGLLVVGPDPSAPLAAREATGAIWEWGRRHGAARDDGAYHEAAPPLERARRLSAERLALIDGAMGTRAASR